MEFRTKFFFFLFLGLYHPVSAKNTTGKRFFHFLNFFAIFFRNFLSRVEYERNSGLKYFLTFSAYLIPFWIKIMTERGFLVFWISLLFFFLKFSCPGRVWTEFGTKFFFFSFSASLNLFWIEIMPELTFLIFWIFLLFFSEFSCPSRVWTEFGT